MNNETRTVKLNDDGTVTVTIEKTERDVKTTTITVLPQDTFIAKRQNDKTQILQIKKNQNAQFDATLAQIDSELAIVNNPQS